MRLSSSDLGQLQGARKKVLGLCIFSCGLVKASEVVHYLPLIHIQRIAWCKSYSACPEEKLFGFVCLSLVVINVAEII